MEGFGGIALFVKHGLLLKYSKSIHDQKIRLDGRAA